MGRHTRQAAQRPADSRQLPARSSQLRLVRARRGGSMASRAEGRGAGLRGVAGSQSWAGSRQAGGQATWVAVHVPGAWRGRAWPAAATGMPEPYATWVAAGRLAFPVGVRQAAWPLVPGPISPGLAPVPGVEPLLAAAKGLRPIRSVASSRPCSWTGVVRRTFPAFRSGWTSLPTRHSTWGSSTQTSGNAPWPRPAPPPSGDGADIGTLPDQQQHHRPAPSGDEQHARVQSPC